VVLIFFWRRLTKTAIILEVVISSIVIGVLPILLPAFASFRQLPAMTVQTPERIVTQQIIAVESDVSERLARQVGEKITKTVTLPPASVYFDSVAHVDAMNPNSPLEGVGRFHTEVYLTGLLGFPVESFSKAGLLTTRFAFTGIFPLVLLILFSLVTPSSDKRILDRFYVKMKTPVAPTPEMDAAEIEKSSADPTRYDHLKLLPCSNWEFCKWTLQDTAGFLISWVGVGAVLVLFWFMMVIGR
jgi:solute:Na+ symporter, SSS family